ncbi:GDSL-like Lipase/Acylhydrolase [Phlyctema vagabunda]|uniref:GDSL-like Lipase/Acylhydrolase n=1 Tax=Phlyctema vagabunda TaxID=108571 RepID=A0ABR4P6C6_9HELO
MYSVLLLAAMWIGVTLSTAMRLESRASTTSIQPSTTTKGMNLRILPLGASITYGVGSTDGNGYRLELYNLLEAKHINVAFVGTQVNGNMANNMNEGYPGRRIEEVQTLARQSGAYEFLPNLVLIHVGTNDCVQDFSTAGAPARLASLVEEVLLAIPNTTVVLSNLVPNRVQKIEQCIMRFNTAIEEIAIQLNADGAKVVFADMHSAVNVSNINESDGVHPTDEGYRIMAHVWSGIIREACSKVSPLYLRY